MTYSLINNFLCISVSSGDEFFLAGVAFDTNNNPFFIDTVYERGELPVKQIVNDELYEALVNSMACPHKICVLNVPKGFEKHAEVLFSKYSKMVNDMDFVFRNEEILDEFDYQKINTMVDFLRLSFSQKQMLVNYFKKAKLLRSDVTSEFISFTKECPEKVSDKNNGEKFFKKFISQGYTDKTEVLGTDCGISYNGKISHIYVEKDALKYNRTTEIIKAFNQAEIILIDSYLDIFHRRNQNYSYQKTHPALILAVNRGGFIYKGSENCQDFGCENFYYASLGKNCPFGCDYCYLQGLFRSANMVIFVNIEECFEETKALYKQLDISENNRMLLSVTYDCDIFAFEKVLSYMKMWDEFLAAEKMNGLTVEFRTKCGSQSLIPEIAKSDNLVLTWSVNSKYVIKNFERRTGTLDARLNCIKKAILSGFKVRISLDPVIVPDFGGYDELIWKINEGGFAGGLDSVSIGFFRMPVDFIKKLRKQGNFNALAFENYVVNDSGSATYGEKYNYLLDNLKKGFMDSGVSEDKIYLL